jgi:ribosomal 50S subunit-recycling heat shock protein
MLLKNLKFMSMENQSNQVKIGDEIAIHYAAKTIIVRVTSLTVIKDHLMYDVIQA